MATNEGDEEDWRFGNIRFSLNRREALTTGSYRIITGVDNTVTAVISRRHILIIFRMAQLAARTHSQCARRSRRESKLRFTNQVRPNRLKSMDARDQRHRQQFSSASRTCSIIWLVLRLVTKWMDLARSGRQTLRSRRNAYQMGVNSRRPCLCARIRTCHGQMLTQSLRT